MSKFTSGKWEYDEPFGVVYSGETGMVIAKVHGVGTGRCFCLVPEGQANARLIAAAPKMYKLLEDAAGVLNQDQLNYPDPLANEIRELLAQIDVEEEDEEEEVEDEEQL